MPYPRHLINEGETVALDLHPHWWYFSKHILTGIPLFVALLGVIALQGNSSNTLKAVVGWGWAILALLWVAWLAIKYVQWQYTHFVVTDDRVIFRTGMLSKHGVEIPLERINNINFHQGIWERIIGAGTLDVQSAGEEGTSQFTDVRHPDGVQQEIYRQMETSGTADAGAGAGAIGEAVAKALRDQAGSGGGAGLSAKIEELAKLRDQGYITPDEYERRKDALLDKM